MDWLTFISKLVAALAWPAVILVLLFLIRNHIGGLAERIEEISLPGGAKARFRRQLETARRIAEEAPPLSINEREIQQNLRLKTGKPEGIMLPEFAEWDYRAWIELAEHHPSAAILDAYKRLEGVLIDIGSKEGQRPRNLADIAYSMWRSGSIDQSDLDLYRRLRSTRNAAVHVSRREVTPGEALEFGELVQQLMLRLLLAKGRYLGGPRNGTP